MKCHCGGALRVTNTYATSGGKTQRLECNKCHTVRNAVTLVLPGESRHGQGAYVLAQKAKNGGSLIDSVKQAFDET